MKNKGFSLVELIVVIAIMAILVGVAVPVYSSYIEKTQKAADVQLVGEIKHAMEIANAGQTLTQSAYVILSSTGATVYAPEGAPADYLGDDQLIDVLRDTFGENWQKELAVKYSGWKADSVAASYSNSNYYGEEERLVGTVDGLTDVLRDTLKTTTGLIGPNYEKYLKDNHGIDVGEGGQTLTDAQWETVSNAAVLYVAEGTLGKQEFINQSIAAATQKAAQDGKHDEFAMNLYNQLTAADNPQRMSSVTAMATVYAAIEGYAQFSGNADKFEVDFSLAEGEEMDVNKAINKICEEYKDLVSLSPDKAMAYVTPGTTNGIYGDIAGYMGMMSQVNSNKGLVDVENPAAFSDGSVLSLLKGYAVAGKMGVQTQQGQIAVIFSVEKNEIVITALPIEIEQ